MKNNETFKNLNDRISFVRRDVEKLAARKSNSLADKIIFDSMDSHLSELMAKQIEADIRHPLVDFLELRLKGVVVDYGTIPLEILGIISTNLAALIQRATHKLTSGKDSQKVPHDIKSSLNLRLADLSPGSTKLGVTFSTGLAELVETIPSKAVKEIFELLQSKDDTHFMNHVAEIGFNSTLSLKKIIDECDKNHLTFDANWAGPFSDGVRSVSIDSNKIKYLVGRLASTSSSNPVTVKMTGELVLLSKYGKLEINVDGERIRATYPLDMLDSIQSKHKVGQAISLMIETIEIHNDRIGLNRKNHSVKSVI